LYAEPSYFFQPAKPCLGAVLLQLGRPAEAEAVFQEDLREVPGNAWSLAGLEQLQKQRGNNPAISGTAAVKYKVSSSCPAFL
jgi:hypothetical protein